MITGGNSIVAKDLINFFLKENFKVIAVYRKKFIKKKIRNKNFIVKNFNFLKPIKINEKIDYVINTIATHEYSSHKSLNDYFLSNIKCVQKIVELSKKKKVKCLFNLSTISIYKNNNYETEENNKIDDNSILGPSKFIGEKLVEISGLNFINLRLPGVLTLDKIFFIRPWLRKIIFSIKKNKKIKIFNENKKFNSLIDTQEIFHFIKFIILNKKTTKGTYNLSASNPIKLYKIIKIISNFYKYNKKINFKNINDDSSAVINIKNSSRN